jgi:hypothetical protein
MSQDLDAHLRLAQRAGDARTGEVCAYLEDASRAADLYDLLAPYRSYNVVIDVGGFCLGPVAHRLGLLATTLHR